MKKIILDIIKALNYELRISKKCKWLKNFISPTEKYEKE